jgi:hypothetical protein
LHGIDVFFLKGVALFSNSRNQLITDSIKVKIKSLLYENNIADFDPPFAAFNLLILQRSDRGRLYC